MFLLSRRSLYGVAAPLKAMRILYAAIDQRVPGTKGGSVHVAAVARGLAALGHELHVLAEPGDGPFPECGVHWHAMTPPLGAKALRWARTGALRRLADHLRPDVIMERYYNFGGEGISAAAAVGATAVLEVNAPVVDHPGSMKKAIDRVLLVEPMRRWRERICTRANLIVTPSAAILPRTVPRTKIVELEWGADTGEFRPDLQAPLPFLRPAGIVALFAGAFRNWHGAIHVVRAIRQLRERGRPEVAAVFIGDGPELPRVREAARGLDHVVFTGAVPHKLMPACIASADIGVAPFDVAAHRPLALGFYWSPLKIFEYMAAGLPVVAPNVDRIPSLVGHEQEGILYDPTGDTALADALERLADDAALRGRLGRAARQRALREYSWEGHCTALAAAIARARQTLR